METRYLLFIIAFIACVFIRTGYERLKESGKVNPASKPMFVFILTVMCGLWISWFILCTLDPFPVDVPEVVRWSGLGLFLVGMVLAVGALFQLRGVENVTHLVTSGLFAKLRHPMYTGFILWIVGWSTFHSAIVSLLVGVLGIANIVYWRHLEENRLRVQFGERYEQYRLTTWF